MMTAPTSAEFDMGDALLDAVRLRVGGDVPGSGIKSIPALKRDPVCAGGFLVSMVSSAVHAYAHAIGCDPVAAVDKLWSKPVRP